MVFKLLSLFVLGVFVVALAFWHPQEKTQQQLDSQVAENDLYLETFELEAYAPNGSISHITKGAALKRNAGTGAYTLEQPLINLTDEKGNTWLLQSQSGRMTANMETAVLEGGVTLTRSDDAGLTLKTPALEVDTVTRLVNSQAGVEITQGSNTINSVNLIANLKTGSLEMNERVRGFYEPR